MEHEDGAAFRRRLYRRRCQSARRGTAEFPQAAGEVAQSKIPPERKKAFTEQLLQGEAMHTQAHRTGDMMKMGESLRILDGIMKQIDK